jgi:hypothetical protein
MPHSRRTVLRRVVLVLLALLLSCAGVGAVIAQTAPGAGNPALLSAEARWATRTFNHYELRLRDKGCLQVIEVRDERVVDVQPNRCEPPPRSVSDLFTLIRRDGKVSTQCILLGCACDDVLSVRASYDQALGFPRQLEVGVAARPNWQHPDYWSQLLAKRRLPDCSVLAVGSKVVAIESITPLP